MKNKVVAALIAFCLGWVGLHKFYLGEIGTGILYLMFSWTFIPGLLSLIDGISLLCMSDRAFNVKYNRAYLPSHPTQQHFFETDSRNRLAESTKDKAEAIGVLKKLYDDDILTAEEYEDKRRKILDSI